MPATLKPNTQWDKSALPNLVVIPVKIRMQFGYKVFESFLKHMSE